MLFNFLFQAKHVRLYSPPVALSLVIIAVCALHLQTMKATPANVLLAGKVMVKFTHFLWIINEMNGRNLAFVQHWPRHMSIYVSAKKLLELWIFWGFFVTKKVFTGNDGSIL